MPKADVTASSASTTKVRIAALIVLALVAVGVYTLDQVTKFLVVANLSEYERVPLLGDFLQLYFVRNPGAAFSIGTGSTWIFAIIASAVVVFIVIFSRRIRSLGWAVLFGLLLGGNAGNLTDRLTREPGFGIGHVVDFIQLWIFPAIFNIADMAIVFSMAMFVILTIRGVRLNGTRVERAAAESESSVAPEESAGESTTESATDSATERDAQ